MKLNETKPYLEMSGELEEQFFSIQDQGMIFDILRNKMYSNPILAICREISCNARDAHREVGATEVPVHIHLPNTLEPYYKVKDFGPGISPDRMSNIFIKYTASTKREDNVQTGGFGLGAKTPFSYSDSFSIITVHEGIQYNYNCFIDETKVGKLMLASSTPTKEKNGTEIIIPVLPKNFSDFINWTEQACRHWDVKPIIKGGDIYWKNPTVILSGDKWAITSSNDYYNRSVKMIVDGIEYPVDIDALRKYADGKLIDAAKGNIVMYFGVGELSLSASREQVYLDERTQKVIRERLDGIEKEIRKRVVDKIELFDNLWLANIYYRAELRTAFSNIDFLGKLSWRGIQLQDSYVYTNCSVYTFSKGKHSRKHGLDPNKLTRRLNNHLPFEENAALFINDLPIKEPTPRHVKKAFDDNPKLKSLHVVCPNDKFPLDKLNSTIHLDKMDPQFMSSITKASARAYTPAASRLIVFKFDKQATAFRQVSYASIEDDATKKVLCQLSKDSYPNTRHPILKNKKYLDLSSLRNLAEKFPAYSFYGVDSSAPADRIAEDFSDFEDIEDFIRDNILHTKTINYLEIKFATSHRHDIDDRMLRTYPQVKPRVSDPDSLYIQRFVLHNKVRQICQADLGLLHIYEAVNGDISDADLAKFAKDHPEYDIEAINKKFHKRYPLLEHLNTYNFQGLVEPVASYINMIDEKLGEKNV